LNGVIYANRKNRALLEDKGIDHAFKRIALPMNPNKTNRNIVANSNKKQGQRNHIATTFGHLKDRFNLDKVKWTIPGGESMQIQLGFIAFNLHTALANA